LEEGDAKGQGLSRAGLGLAAHVASSQGIGDGHGLDGERRGDSLSFQGFDQGWVNTQRSKGARFAVRRELVGFEDAIRWIDDGCHLGMKLTLICSMTAGGRPSTSVRVTNACGPASGHRSGLRRQA
jgi:hypothetical protein